MLLLWRGERVLSARRRGGILWTRVTLDETRSRKIERVQLPQVVRQIDRKEIQPIRVSVYPRAHIAQHRERIAPDQQCIGQVQFAVAVLVHLTENRISLYIARLD